MKFGFRTGGFKGWDIDSIIKELAHIGFDGVELCLESPDMRPEKFTPKWADKINGMINKAGLEIASVSYHADAEPSDQRRLNTSRTVGIAEWLGVNIVIINAERIREGEKEDQWKDLVDWLKELTAHAEGKNINIAIEPEPLLVVNDTDDMIRLMEDVGASNLKVNLDVGHAYITDQSLPESIRKLGSSIIHTHIEDIKNKVHNHLEIGQGDIDFKSMHEAFMEIGYNGYYVVDLFRLGDDPSGVASRTLEALKERFC
jgi:sugar phosphate isomerase/epimerase